jgi:hypothetical protein
VGVWDHAEHARTKTLERLFSAASIGGAGAAMLHGIGNRCSGTRVFHQSRSANREPVSDTTAMDGAATGLDGCFRHCLHLHFLDARDRVRVQKIEVVRIQGLQDQLQLLRVCTRDGHCRIGSAVQTRKIERTARLAN